MTTPRPGVHISPEGLKTLIPLENNPQVFTDLIHRLGLDPDLTFYDVWSVDEPALLNHIPRPVHALIFIAPADVYHRVRANDPGSKKLTYDGSGPNEPVIWFKQTMGHTCGLMALIHSVCNGTARQFVKPGSLLDKLLQECIPLKPLPRAKVLYDSQALEDAHMASAAVGDTAPPSSAEPNGYATTCTPRGRLLIICVGTTSSALFVLPKTITSMNSRAAGVGPLIVAFQMCPRIC